MAELQFQAEVEPQLLNGDDLNEEREEADASESVKKKRRKKKRSRTTAPGKERILRLEDPFKENSAKKKIYSPYCSVLCRALSVLDMRLFQPVRGYSCPDVPTLSGCC